MKEKVHEFLQKMTESFLMSFTLETKFSNFQRISENDLNNSQKVLVCAGCKSKGS